MLSFLYPLILCGGLWIWYRLLRRSTRDATRNGVNSRRMIAATSTNNSYPPMGDIFDELDGARDILGGGPDADMRGYMDGG